ncbi:MAG: hypothetical protein ACM33V_05095 [Chloroflexota bacterium]|nr:hypothetical protein [Anaerolineales bacterium]
MMIKVDTNPLPLTYPTNSQKGLESGHHLIVLVPANIDFNNAAQRIWTLAQTGGMQIRLIGLCKDMIGEAKLRRELIAAAARLQDGRTCAEVKVVAGSNWVEAVKPNFETGDVIVCFAEHQAGLLQRPLSQILTANFQTTVYILSGLTSQKPRSNRLLQISTWLGSVATIVAFGILQAKIVQLPQGALQTTLLILSLIPEFWLIGTLSSQPG